MSADLEQAWRELDTAERAIRTGSLCSGYEGLGLAVQAVLGGELAWVADNDPGASAILAHRFPSVPNLGDITEVNWAAVEPVEILTAGFPCQDVSCAGGRAGLREGNRTGVWAYVARAINELRPSLVVLENVRGLLSAGADSDLELCAWCLGEAGTEHALRACGAVLGDLADILYDARGTVVSAADAGAPHRRERVFIVASDARGGELQRRGIARILGIAAAAELGQGDQRERAGDAASDSRPATLADAGGERRDGWPGVSRNGRSAPIREQARNHGSDGSGSLAQDADRAAGGERRQPAPGQAARGRPRADAGGSGGAPATCRRPRRGTGNPGNPT
jgi:site-specific DNA-cytosine methylase